MEHYYAMIMAGGGGTRLWPMSRKNTPKQMLPLVEDYSMFRVSVERLSPLFAPDHIYIVTGRDYLEAQRAEVPQIPPENFILEPYGKDNGPATLLGVSTIYQRDPQATIAFLTVDHHIADKSQFRSVLGAAYQLAQQDYITTLGISPSFPSTGFGYIQRGDLLAEFDGFRCFVSRGFREKPDEAAAAAFIASGDYSWNSGMFIFRAQTALAEFERQQPDMYALFTTLRAVMGTADYPATLEQTWETVKRISIDYAIMQGAQRVAVIPVDIGWNDVGSWSALYEVLELDKLGNVLKVKSNAQSEEEPIMIDTHNTLVYNNTGRLIVTIGVGDLVVVDMDDVLLLCHKDQTQVVKQVVNQLQQRNKGEYL